MSSMPSFCKKVRLLFQVLFLVTPLLTILYWLNIEQAILLQINPFSVPLAKVTFNHLSKTLGFAISLIPMTVVMILFHKLKTLFKNYENGSVFSQENVSLYKKLGVFLFVLAFVNLLCSALMSFALSFQNVVGERFIAISLGTSQVLPIMIGLVILGISYVMQEALYLEEDKQFTI